MAGMRVVLDEVVVNTEKAEPFTFTGPFSGKSLAGMHLKFSVASPGAVEAIDAVVKRATARVEDPFAGRQYEAKLRMTTMSYTEGRPEKRYDVEVKEVDRAPECTQLEIDGQVVPVLKYGESEYEEGVVERVAVLRLSADELRRFRDLLRPGEISVRRVGVDSEPLKLRYGARQYWSEHEEDGQRYFKQLVRLFPADLPASRMDLASGMELRGLERIVIRLSARLEALVERLSTLDVLSPEIRKEIMESRAADLVGNARLVEMASEVERVNDAEEDL